MCNNITNEKRQNITAINIILLFTSVNTLWIFPVDKVCILLLLIILFIKSNIKREELLFFSFFIMIQSAIIAINYFMGEVVSVIVYFPVIGTLFACLGGRYFKTYEIRFILIVHIILALFFLIDAYIKKNNQFVHRLYDKGLPFLIAPMGFTATVQTFGTLCLSYLILALDEKKIDFYFLITFFMLIMTFNRVSYMNMLVYVFLLRPGYVLFFLLLLIISFAIFPDVLLKLLGSTGTIKSRANYIESYILAFSNNSPFQKIFGSSNSVITDSYVLSVTEQPLIENGVFALLNTYGILFIFLFVMVLSTMPFLKKNKDDVKYKIYLCYFITFAQFMTNEYFSSSFYLAIMSIVVLINKIQKNITNR
jgi:hypothetical protein